MMNFLFKAKKTSKEAGPPEREFLDPPEGLEKLQFSIRDLLESRRVKWGVVFALIVLVLLFLALPKKREAVKGTQTMDEKRVVMTTASMERAIGASAKVKPVEVVEKPSRIVTGPKRKLDSRMAVFVFKKESQGRDSSRTEKLKEPGLGLPSGTKVPALLEDRVISFNVEAPVLATLAKDFIYKDKVVIPKDSKFLGAANVVKSIDRINVRFDTLVFPDGREVRVKAMALAEDGASGIKGKVEKHTDMKMLKAIGESALSIGSLFLGSRSQDAFSLEDQMRMNVSQNLSDEARKSLRDVKVEKSVTVEAYQPIYVLLLDAV